MRQTANVETSYVCHCARITPGDFEKILHDSGSPTYAELKAKFGIGGQCTSCEYEVKGLLDEYLTERGQKAKTPAKPVTVDRWEQVAKRVRKMFAPREEIVRETYRTGVFCLRRDGLESHLVVSNLRFPERTENPNGERVAFRVTLYDESGKRAAESREFQLADNATFECAATDLFPDVKGDIVGGMYTDFDSIAQTGSLRPYGVLVNTTAGAGMARCHYHDKFALFTDPGYFQNTSPFEPGQDCWMSLSNCQPKPYETEYRLLFNGEKLTHRFAVEPMASKWVRLRDLFPELGPDADPSPALFWLENAQHVMVYFFWHIESLNLWMAQHH